MIFNEEGLIQTFMARIRADMPNPGEQIPEIVKEVYGLLAAERLSPEGTTKLHQAAMDRLHRQAAAASNKDRIGFFAAKAAKKVDSDEPAIPDEIQDETRTRIRRYLGRVASIPALFASLFSVAEQAVLSQIAIQCRTHGQCVLTHGMLAYRARCSERTVRYALSKAKGHGLISVKGRSRMASIITVISQTWRDWWSRPAGKAENQKPNKNIILDPPHPAKTCQYVQNAAPLPEAVEPVLTEVEPAAVEAFEAEPTPVAPVTPTSFGHAPRVKPDARPTFLEHLDKVLSGIPKPEPKAQDEWDRPMVSRACEEAIGPWMNHMGATIELTGRGWAHVLRDGKKTREVIPTVLDWLEGRVGRGKYGFRGYLGVTGRQIFLGFERREDGAAFRKAWSGATAG